MSDPTDNPPRGWTSTALGEIAYVNPRWTEHEPADSALVSFIPMAAVEAGSGRLDPVASRIWREVKKGYTKFQEGDVLFAKITPCMENGKVALAVGLLDGRGAGSTEFHVLRAIDEVASKFILYFLLQEKLRHDARLKMRGAAGQLRVPPEFLEALSLPLPPAREQQRIVAEIEKQFTRLEAGTAALGRVQANLKCYRAAVLKAAVEGRLVPTEAEVARREGRSYEPASELLKRILAERKQVAQPLLAVSQNAKAGLPGPRKKKYKEPVAPDTGNLPKLPEGWAWASTMQVGGIQLGRQRSPKHHSGTHMRPYLRVANVFEDRIDVSDVLEMNFTPSEFQTYELGTGDILLNEGQSLELVGRPAMYRDEVPGACFQNTLVRFRAYNEIDPRFALIVFRAHLHSKRFQKIARWTTNMAHLGAERFSRVEFPVPPTIEQSRIIAEVERRLSVVDELEMQVEANLKRAERLRQALLKRAFEGRLVPQDPNDEPASVLLERIKAARGTATPGCAPSKKNKSKTKGTGKSACATTP